MCDYSLAEMPNRLAVAGEELVVHRFRSGSVGLVAPADLRPTVQPWESAPRRSLWKRLKSVFEESPDIVAVCVPPGANLLLRNIPKDLQRQWHVKDEESVFFVQVSAVENIHRDAVQFRHGHPVLLQHLPEGMPVEVLSLGGAEVSEEQDFEAYKRK